MQLLLFERTRIWLLIGFVLAIPQVCRALTAVDIVKLRGSSVVLIVTPSKSQGSGVIISPDGAIATAAHVAEALDESSFVKLKTGERYPISDIQYFDPDSDLAILRIKDVNLPFSPVVDSTRIEIGSQVFAIGNPEGLENSVSDGILSGRRAFSGQHYWLQTTAPISPGSSGGGLFDESGNLVGITIGSFRTGQNLNFAVPISLAFDGGSVKRQSRFEYRLGEGKKLAKAYCTLCHGELLDGKPTDSKVLGMGLDPFPNDLTNTNTYKQGTSVEAISDTIRHGVKGTAMPPWDVYLNEQEIENLAIYIKSIQK